MPQSTKVSTFPDFKFSALSRFQPCQGFKVRQMWSRCPLKHVQRWNLETFEWLLSVLMLLLVMMMLVVLLLSLAVVWRWSLWWCGVRVDDVDVLAGSHADVDADVDIGLAAGTSVDVELIVGAIVATQVSRFQVSRSEKPSNLETWMIGIKG